MPLELMRSPLFLAFIVIPMVWPFGPVAHIRVTPQESGPGQRKRFTCAPL